MTRTVLLGKLPLIQTGLNKNRLDRRSTAKQFGLSYNQIYKAYNNWIQIFRVENSTLTFEEYLYKLKESVILPDDVGNNNEQYHLSRYNDEGPYTNTSCRFILKIENLMEQDHFGLGFQKGFTPWNKKLDQ